VSRGYKEPAKRQSWEIFDRSSG